jgi:hypothetical protein
VGLSSSWIPLLGGLKAAGAAGLLVGLAGVRLIGLAVPLGLVLFFIGAVVAHVFTPSLSQRLSGAGRRSLTLAAMDRYQAGEGFGVAGALS